MISKQRAGRRRATKAKAAGFVRRTVTIPAELVGHVTARKNSPVHAGNLSSYFRSLILADKPL